MKSPPADLAPIETEAKYRLARALAPTALASLRLAPYTLRFVQDARQDDALLDTPDHQFYHRGYALRLRRTHNRLTLTLKRPGQMIGSVHLRAELEAPTQPDDAFTPRRWPAVIATPVLALIGDAPVAPLVELHTLRETWRVERAGQMVAELVVDDGTLVADGATADIREVEVELKGAGAPDDLGRLDRQLRKRLRLTPEPDSKFARGMALLERATPHQGGYTPLAEVGLRLLTDETQKLRKHGAWLERHSHPHRLGGDPDKAADHIHKLRVITRRLRITLQLVEAVPGMRARRLRRLGARLQDLGHALGALRDSEIVQQELAAQLPQRATSTQSASGGPADMARGRQLVRLAHTQDAQRRFAQARLHSTLQRGDISTLTDGLERVARRLRRRGGAPAGPAGATSAHVVRMREVVGGMLWRYYEAVERLGAVAMRSAALPDDRHRLRRACKRLRYALEALTATRSAIDMNDLLLTTATAAQDHLGEVQDHVLLLRALGDKRVDRVDDNGYSTSHQRRNHNGREEQPGRMDAIADSIADAIVDATHAKLAQGVAAFWPLWERLSGAPYRAALAETIARL